MDDPRWVVGGLAVAWYLCLCAVPSCIARERGHRPGKLFTLSLLASPLVGILYAMALPVSDREAVALREGRLCTTCGEILDARLSRGELCPKCMARK